MSRFRPALHYHFLHHQHCKNYENYERNININSITITVCLWRKLILSNTYHIQHIEYHYYCFCMLLRNFLLMIIISGDDVSNKVM